MYILISAPLKSAKFNIWTHLAGIDYFSLIMYYAFLFLINLIIVWKSDILNIILQHLWILLYFVRVFVALVVYVDLNYVPCLPDNSTVTPRSFKILTKLPRDCSCMCGLMLTQWLGRLLSYLKPLRHPCQLSCVWIEECLSSYSQFSSLPCLSHSVHFQDFSNTCVKLVVSHGFVGRSWVWFTENPFKFSAGPYLPWMVFSNLCGFNYTWLTLPLVQSTTSKSKMVTSYLPSYWS